MEEDYVSFEVAKLLKERGFDADTEHNMWYVVKKFSTGCHWNSCTYKVGDITREYDKKCCILMPTLQMAMKWLRKTHNLHICIFIGEDSSCDADGNPVDMWHFWSYNVTNLCGDMVYDAYDKLDCVEYQSYEDAAEASIKFCLENLI